MDKNVFCTISFIVLFILLTSVFFFFFFPFCKGLSQRNELSSEVGVVGQRVTYSNGTIKTEEETSGPSPPLVKPAFRESVRALKPAKGASAVMSKQGRAFSWIHLVIIFCVLK